MLSISHVHKTFNIGKENETTVLTDVSLSFPDAGLFVILGPSGSGKSTLLSLIGALDSPTSGSILYDEIDVTSLKGKKADAYRESYVSFAFQEHNLIPYLSISRNVALKAKEDDPNKETLLSSFGLASHKRKKPSSLSGGERQRAAIARSLLGEGKLLLCDEPTSSLDKGNAKAILGILKEASKKRLVILVTHDEELISPYADGVIRIRDGKVESASMPSLNKVDDKSSNNPSEIIDKKVYKEATTYAESNGDKEVSKASATLKKSPIYRRGLVSRALSHTLYKGKESLLLFVLSFIAFFALSCLLGFANGTNALSKRTVADMVHFAPLTISSYYENITSVTMLAKEKDNYSLGINITQGSDLLDSLHKNVVTDSFISYLLEGLGQNCYLSYNADKSQSLIYEENGSYRLFDEQSSDSLSDYVASFFGKAPTLNPLLYEEEYFKSRYAWLGGSYPRNGNEAILVYTKHNGIPNEISTLLDLHEGDDPSIAIGRSIHIAPHQELYMSNFTKEVTGHFLKDKETLAKQGKDVRALSNYAIKLANAYYNGDVPTQNKAMEEIKSLFEEEVSTKTLTSFAKIQNSGALGALIEEGKTDDIVISGIATIPEDSTFNEKYTGILIPSAKLEEISKKNATSDIAKEIDSHIVLPDSTSRINFPKIYGYLNMVNETSYSEIETYLLSFVQFYESRKFFSVNNEVSSIEIFVPDLASKDSFLKRIEDYNKKVEDEYDIKYLDFSSNIITYTTSYTSIIEKVLIIVSIVALLIFAALSMAIAFSLTSSRAKEVGIYRSCGYGKAYVFFLLEIENLLIGLTSGALGVGIANIIAPFASRYFASQDMVLSLKDLMLLNPTISILVILAALLCSFLAVLLPSLSIARKKPMDVLKS